MQGENIFENELKNILLSNYDFCKKVPLYKRKCNFLLVKLRKMLTNVENVNILCRVINILRLHVLGNLFHIFAFSTLSNINPEKIILTKNQWFINTPPGADFGPSVSSKNN